MHEQGETIDSIEANIERTHVSVRQATAELRKASNYMVSWCFIFILISSEPSRLVVRTNFTPFVHCSCMCTPSTDKCSKEKMYAGYNCGSCSSHDMLVYLFELVMIYSLEKLTLVVPLDLRVYHPVFLPGFFNYLQTDCKF